MAKVTSSPNPLRALGPVVARTSPLEAARAGKAWGVVFPRERWAVRLGVGTINLFQRLRRKRFRVYLHGRDRIAAEAARHGLVPARSARTFFWEVRVFRRSGPRPD